MGLLLTELARNGVKRKNGRRPLHHRPLGSEGYPSPHYMHGTGPPNTTDIYMQDRIHLGVLHMRDLPTRTKEKAMEPLGHYASPRIYK